MQEIPQKRERVLLVYVYKDNEDVKYILDELTGLVESAGGEVVDTVIQKRNGIDPQTVLGSGKLEEVARYAENLDIDAVIFENELTPSQIAAIDEIIDCKVIDRTTLILDIFASRAKSAEGKLQVELAQMKYNLPRLIGSRKDLSRLGGGIGTRGPGETKLETDKRHIRKRISVLESRIDEIEKTRANHRKKREKNEIPCVALVGYTNAGKSSLLNALTCSDVYVADRLFATLDPSARKLVFDNGSFAVITDTVGFIRNIPTDLIASFRSTLEEALHADLILNVCDVSDANHEAHCSVTLRTLEELGVTAPVVTVYNKCDLLPRTSLERYFSSGKLLVSARTGEGFVNLKKRIETALFGESVNCWLVIPYTDGKALASLRKNAVILRTEILDDRIAYDCVISEKLLREYSAYLDAPRKKIFSPPSETNPAHFPQ